MRYIFLILSAFIIVNASYAGTIYQWKDEAGKTHFTDNLGFVPPEYREGYERKLSDYDSKEAKQPAQDMGKELWQTRCESCHYFGDQASGSSAINLSKFLTDPVSGKAVNYQVLSMSLASILESHDSYIKKKLNKDQIVALSRYLSEAQNKLIVESEDNL
jgi:hypothetical protein